MIYVIYVICVIYVIYEHYYPGPVFNVAVITQRELRGWPANKWQLARTQKRMMKICSYSD